MPAPFGLLIVFRVDSLCFVFRNLYYQFVLLLFLLFSVVCAIVLWDIYIYVTFKGTFNHAEIGISAFFSSRNGLLVRV